MKMMAAKNHAAEQPEDGEPSCATDDEAKSETKHQNSCGIVVRCLQRLLLRKVQTLPENQREGTSTDGSTNVSVEPKYSVESGSDAKEVAVDDSSSKTKLEQVDEAERMTMENFDSLLEDALNGELEILAKANAPQVQLDGKCTEKNDSDGKKEDARNWSEASRRSLTASSEYKEKNYSKSIRKSWLKQADQEMAIFNTLLREIRETVPGEALKLVHGDVVLSPRSSAEQQDSDDKTSETGSWENGRCIEQLCLVRNALFEMKLLFTAYCEDQSNAMTELYRKVAVLKDQVKKNSEELKMTEKQLMEKFKKVKVLEGFLTNAYDIIEYLTSDRRSFRGTY